MNEGKKELRLALGMRGGVSLAIWIGGACAEIDRLRRADTDPVDFWPELLAVSDYDRAIVDVIAGASAGGLNGVLYAASQQYGFDLDGVRETWLRVAGLAELTRKEMPDLSVLDGDRKFLDVLDLELDRLVRAGSPPATRPRLDVQLSATLVTPITRPAPATDDEPLRDVRYMSRFHFEHEPRAEGWAGTDFPADHDAVAAVIAKLALAGRATSSFPAAFEPAIVRSTRPLTFADDELPTSVKRHVDMRGVFADARGSASTHAALQGDDFVVADGGILDNIPLGKALRAVANATADRPTKRYLVYLHPTGPTEMGQEPPALDPAPSERAVEYARRSALGVLTGAFGSRMQAETTLGDVAQMEEYNRAGRLAGAMRDAAFRPVLASGALPMIDVATAALGRYELERSLGDARAIGALLDDPLAALGTDVFPSTISCPHGTVQVDDDTWRAPVARWASERRESIGADLVRRFGERLPGGDGGAGIEGVFHAGTGPLERVVRLMIEWARHLDRPDRLDRSTSTVDPGLLRQHLYDVAMFVRRELARPRDLAWVTCAAAAPDGSDWHQPPLRRVDSLLQVEGTLADEVCRELSDDHDVAARTEFAATMRRRLDELMVADEGPPASTTRDIRTAIVDQVLVPIARQLVTCEVVADDTPGSVLHRALTTCRDQLAADPAAARQVLAALEVLCYQEVLVSSQGGAVEFVRMSAANRTPLNDAFEGLAEKRPDGSLIRDADGHLPRLAAARKLAGNELMNFAAFAKAEWRANDWLWGRLDATSTLVDLLVTPASLPRIVGPGGTADPDPGLGRIRGLACPDTADDAWQRHFETEVWEPRAEDITELLSEHRTDPADAGVAQQLVAQIRDAVLARRQWEILADELGKEPWSTSGAPLDPAATVAAVKAHTVGLDTFRTKPVKPHVEMFKELSDAAGTAVTQTVHTARNPGAADGPADRTAKWSGRIVRFGGRVATEVLLRPKRFVAETAIGAGLFIAAIVALVIWS